MAAKSKPNRRQDRPVRRTFNVRETLVSKYGTEDAEALIGLLYGAAARPKRRRRRR